MAELQVHTHFLTARSEGGGGAPLSSTLPNLRPPFPRIIPAHSSSPGPRKSPIKQRLTIDELRHCADVFTPSSPTKNITLHLPPVKGSCIPPSVSRVIAVSQTGSRKGISKAHNQDAYFHVEFEGWRALGICDGHGANGHRVSGFLSAQIPPTLSTHLSKLDPKSVRDALLSAYSQCSATLRHDPIDSSNSGSTCLTVVILKAAIVCANVGDSRAVLGRNTHGIWSVFQLSWDHKPEIPEELERIVSSGGEVCVSKSSHVGPLRVYLKSRSYPGLSMSRSMGDEGAATAGVISQPDVEIVRLTPSDKFIIAASDGLWEVMTSLEAVQRVAASLDRGDSEVCERLIEEAKQRWTKRGTTVDDITVVITIFGV